MWENDGDGVQLGGDVGGDIQAGDSFSIRYRRSDLPGSMVTITAYPVGYENCPDEFVVQTQTEYLVCTDPSDPGGTEVWSDVNYSDGYEVYDTSAEAEGAARDKATAMLGYADTETWNGQPFQTTGG